MQKKKRQQNKVYPASSHEQSLAKYIRDLQVDNSMSAKDLRDMKKELINSMLASDIEHVECPTGGRFLLVTNYTLKYIKGKP